MDANKDLVVYEARDGQEIKLSFATIKKYLVQGHPEYVTDQEMVYYMGICKSRGINPFNKDCYLMKYSQKDNAALIVSIDYKRKLARTQKDCQGWEAGIIIERNGQIIYSNGLILEGDKLLGGWFEAQPEGFSKPRRHEVNLAAYIKKTTSGEITAFWKKEKQPMMIAKVAESQGLNMIWPGEFAKLYTPEEMGDPDMFKTAEDVTKGQPTNLNDKLKPTKEKKTTEAKDPYATKAKPESVETEGTTEEVSKEVAIRKVYVNLGKRDFKRFLKAEQGDIPGYPVINQDEIYAKWQEMFPNDAYPLAEVVDESPVEEPEVVQEEKPETELKPIMLNCRRTREEIPEKNNEERIPVDFCENSCNPEWRGGCIAFGKYQDNIRT